MKSRISKLLVVIMAICCALCGCAKEEMDPEKYTSYKCYDYHLMCLKTKGKSAMTEYSYYSGEHSFSKDFRILKIADESDDQFIWAKHVILYGSLDKVVMQNPDNYVDVWNDWSIEKIELYYLSLEDESEFQFSIKANVPTEVMASTSDGEFLTHFKSFVDDCEKIEDDERNFSIGYIRSSKDELGKVLKLYVRVYFNESKNIVWDTEVESYYLSEDQGRMIYIDAGNETERISAPINKYVSIDDDQLLYDWISNAIVNFDFTAYN